MDGCTDGGARGGLPGELDVVRGHVSDAVLALRRALVADWVSVAADGYRALVTEHLAAVRRLGAQIDAADSLVRTAQVKREEAGGPW